MTNIGFENLSAAIVRQAVYDYTKYLQRKRKLENRKMTDDVIEKLSFLYDQIRTIEQFFRSQWFQVLCSYDGESMISAIKKKVGI